MRVAFWPGNSQPLDEVVDVSRHAAATGWERIYFADHFLPFTGAETGPVHECWVVLGGLATAVPDVQLSALVTGNTYRNPAVLAKMAVALDHLSGGRAVLGLGAGWQENEHRAYGIPFPSVRERLDRLDEACQIIRLLLDNETSDFTGAYYDLDAAPLAPKPLGPLPLLIGGGGERRTLAIAATYADEWNVWGTPELLTHKMRVLDEHCASRDRDPATIARSAVSMLVLSDDAAYLAKMRDRDFGRPCMVGTAAEVQETVAAYIAAGVDELVIPDFTMTDPARKRDMLDQFQSEVAAPLR